jgi:hypothetical protein
MRLRTYLALAVLACLVVAAIVLPGTRVVREAVLERVGGMLAEAGYDVSFEASGGNLWRGVTLRQVRVSGPGVAATAEVVRVHYFLPPLLTGELPVGLRVEGLDGHVDVAELADVLAPPADPVAPPAVRVRVQDVDVVRSRLALGGIPFDLPDVSVEGMHVVTDADGVRAALTVVSAEGRAELVAHTRLGSDAVDIEVVAADARLGRHWWEGVSGGVGRGLVRVRDGVVGGDLTIEDGTIDALGVTVRDIAGPVTWRGHEIRASLVGAALGGRLAATGRVDAVAQRWDAIGTAEAELDEVVAALWALGAPLSPLPSEGAVRAEVRAEGWVHSHVVVDAVAEGRVSGEPLEDLAAHVVWDSLTGLSVDAEGDWAGGPIHARVRSAADETEVVASLRDATWSGIDIAAADADLRLVS